MPNGIFGTDGVRGRVNTYPMTAETAMRLAQAAAPLFRGQGGPASVVIGKDTRRSGYMLETAMIAGFTSVGLDVVQAGPIPTPAVAMLTRQMRASLGVMISASHNPYWDNGIKFFGPDGYKLTDDQELMICSKLRHRPELVDADRIGGVQRVDSAQYRYVTEVCKTFPPHLSLRGLKIVVDAAHGAAYRCAPEAMAELGADVVTIGCAPDGMNINSDCGSTHPLACQEAVVAHGADLGICLDGDADRLLMIDETGHVVDGDQLLALIAGRMLDQRMLRGPSLVATIMSNMGLERHLADRGIALARANVGDRHVLELMRAIGCNLGGEQSGHIILSDHSTTGDALLAAMQVLAAIVETGRPASQVLNRFQPLPQVHRSIVLEAGALPLADADFDALLSDTRSKLGAHGRLVVRASGTEPVLRVMIEGECLSEIATLSNQLCTALDQALTPDWTDGPGAEPLCSASSPEPVWIFGGQRDDAPARHHHLL